MIKPKIVNFDEAHKWQKSNPYLIRGYRKDHKHIKHIINSAFTKNNQMMNFWTHFAPIFIIFIITYNFQNNTE